MSGLVANNIFKASGVIAAAAGGLSWQPVVTSNFSAAAGKGYWVNTTSNTITITLPSSPEKGDQIILVDYARTWATYKIIIDSNGSNYQGQPDSYTVEYSTNGEVVNIVYSDGTKGWIPQDDDEVADVPAAPRTQRAIFGFGMGPSFTGATNLVNSAGVVQNDTAIASGVTARRQLAAGNYDGDKGIIFGGVTSPGGNSYASRISNLVSAAGVVASDTANASGVTVKYQTAMSNFGSSGQCISCMGTNVSEGFINLRNIIANTGAIANDVSGAGTARTSAAAAPYGGDKAIVAYGYPDPSTNISNKISNTGVVAADTSGVGTARTIPGAAGYGFDKAVFAFGEYTNKVNLVSNTGVVASDTTAGGTARNLGAGATYGGDKALFWGGNADPGGKLNVYSLVTNQGVVGNNQTGVGTAKSNIMGTNINFSA